MDHGYWNSKQKARSRLSITANTISSTVGGQQRACSTATCPAPEVGRAVTGQGARRQGLVAPDLVCHEDASIMASREAGRAGLGESWCPCANYMTDNTDESLPPALHSCPRSSMAVSRPVASMLQITLVAGKRGSG